MLVYTTAECTGRLQSDPLDVWLKVFQLDKVAKKKRGKEEVQFKNSYLYGHFFDSGHYRNRLNYIS